MTPRIYVACLASYNAGILHGEWIDANQDAESIHEDIQAMLSRSPEPCAEEWAIHDYEGFGSLSLSEYEDIERVAAIAGLIAEHDGAFTAWMADYPSRDVDAEAFLEDFAGEWDSEEDFAEELAEDTGAYDSGADHGWPLNCIDWERAARDLFLGDYWSADSGNGSVYVFRRF